MVFLPNMTPLVQIRNSPHAALLPDLAVDAFRDAMETVVGLLLNVDLAMFRCLMPDTWLHDEIVLNSGKGVLLDFSEVCILDSQHARTILTGEEECAQSMVVHGCQFHLPKPL